MVTNSENNNYNHILVQQQKKELKELEKEQQQAKKQFNQQLKVDRDFKKRIIKDEIKKLKEEELLMKEKERHDKLLDNAVLKNDIISRANEIIKNVNTTPLEKLENLQKLKLENYKSFSPWNKRKGNRALRFTKSCIKLFKNEIKIKKLETKKDAYKAHLDLVDDKITQMSKELEQMFSKHLKLMEEKQQLQNLPIGLKNNKEISQKNHEQWKVKGEMTDLKYKIDILTKQRNKVASKYKKQEDKISKTIVRYKKLNTQINNSINRQYEHNSKKLRENRIKHDTELRKMKGNDVSKSTDKKHTINFDKAKRKIAYLKKLNSIKKEHDIDRKILALKDLKKSHIKSRSTIARFSNDTLTSIIDNNIKLLKAEKDIKSHNKNLENLRSHGIEDPETKAKIQERINTIETKIRKLEKLQNESTEKASKLESKLDDKSQNRMQLFENEVYHKLNDHQKHLFDAGKIIDKLRASDNLLIDSEKLTNYSDKLQTLNDRYEEASTPVELKEVQFDINAIFNDLKVFDNKLTSTNMTQSTPNVTKTEKIESNRMMRSEMSIDSDDKNMVFDGDTKILPIQNDINNILEKNHEQQQNILKKMYADLKNPVELNGLKNPVEQNQNMQAQREISIDENTQKVSEKDFLTNINNLQDIQESEIFPPNTNNMLQNNTLRNNMLHYNIKNSKLPDSDTAAYKEEGSRKNVEPIRQKTNIHNTGTLFKQSSRTFGTNKATTNQNEQSNQRAVVQKKNAGISV